MSEAIKTAVRDRYGEIARSACGGVQAGEAERIARAFGYSALELAAIPEGANLGVSCGNPTALASLRPGEVVLDLGSGAGLDVFLAAQKVGPAGRAIGVDMTPDMVERARDNAARAGLANVEFHLAEIESLPLPDASVDCVVSNCVLNLVPDKARAFAEIFRVLKPGGRLAASDVALKQPLPDVVAGDVLAYVGCVAGAILIDDYVRLLREAGFSAVSVTDSAADLNVYLGPEQNSGSCCGGPQVVDLGGETGVPAWIRDLAKRYDFNDYAASVKVCAVKTL